MITNQDVEEIMEAIRDIENEPDLEAFIRQKLEEAFMNGMDAASEEF